MINRSVSPGETQIIWDPSGLISGYFLFGYHKEQVTRLVAWRLQITHNSSSASHLYLGSWLTLLFPSLHYASHHVPTPPSFHSITAAVLQGNALRSTWVWQVYTWMPKNTSSIFHVVDGFKWSYQVWVDLQAKQETEWQQKGASKTQ